MPKLWVNWCAQCATATWCRSRRRAASCRWCSATDSPERDLADYLDLNPKDMSATYVRGPKLADVPYPVKMEPHLAIESDSR